MNWILIIIATGLMVYFVYYIVGIQPCFFCRTSQKQSKMIKIDKVWICRKCHKENLDD